MPRSFLVKKLKADAFPLAGAPAPPYAPLEPPYALPGPAAGDGECGAGGSGERPPHTPLCAPDGAAGGIRGVMRERDRGARGGQEEGDEGVPTLRPAGPVLVRLCGSPTPSPAPPTPAEVGPWGRGDSGSAGDGVTADPALPAVGGSEEGSFQRKFWGARSSRERGGGGGGAGLSAVPAAFIVRSPAPLRQLRARCHLPGHNGGGGGSPLPGTGRGTKGGQEGGGAPRTPSFGVTPGRALCGSPALSRDPRRGEPGVCHGRGRRWGRFSQVTVRLLPEPQAALGAAMGPIQPHAANAALRVLISDAQHRGGGQCPRNPGVPFSSPPYGEQQLVGEGCTAAGQKLPTLLSWK